MSAAVPGTEASKCEPNLTPLLDLVLPMIILFRLTANFVMEQENEAILSESLAAAESSPPSPANEPRTEPGCTHRPAAST